MKKIYTITFHHVLNYGAVLQAYALCKFLKDLNVECEIIDYRPSYFLFQTYRPNKNIFKTFFKIKKNYGFYQFRKNFLPLTNKVFIQDKSLRKYFQNSEDVFICGSDQIWNQELTQGKLSEGYFLKFVPERAKKVAYAASMGNTAFKEGDKEMIVKNLSSYFKLGVREDFVKQQIDLISESSVETEIVLDPTFLLTKEQYEPLIDYSIVPEEEYIVTYLTEDSQLAIDYIEEIRKRTNLKVINLGHHKLKNVDKNYLYLSPSKWLGVFAKAKIVCTNSFHGTAYSLIFKKNFTVISRSKKKRLNRRQLTVLEKLGIVDRFINSVSEISDNHITEIDYQTIDHNYNQLVLKSKNFLKELIKEVD